MMLKKLLFFVFDITTLEKTIKNYNQKLKFDQ